MGGGASSAVTAAVKESSEQDIHDVLFPLSPENREKLVSALGKSEYDSFFRDGRLVPAQMQLKPLTIGSLVKTEGVEVEVRYHEEFKCKVAVLDGTHATYVSPLGWSGRHEEETWAFWLNPRIGESTSRFHRFIRATGSNCDDEESGNLWMDFFGKTRQLAVMDKSHDAEVAGAKTKTELEDGKWYHYAISFSAAGKAVVYVNGEEDAVADMEPPAQRRYQSLGFGNSNPDTRSGRDDDRGQDYGLSAHVVDLRHYRSCLAPRDVGNLFAAGPQ